MRIPGWSTRPAAIALMLALAAPAWAKPATRPPQPIDPKTWTDHDGRPAPKPKEREKKLYRHQLREAVNEPLSHAFDIPDKILALAGLLGADTQHPAVNVNAYDEVPNSTWFTNRNHFQAMALDSIRLGPARKELVPVPPYTVKSRKKGGVNPGFTVKDAKGQRWIVKLDHPGYPQLGSGADVVVGRLLYAAGYNVSHDVAFSFERKDLKIDEELAKGKDGDAPFSEADLDSLLARGHRSADGRSYGQASLYLQGIPVGPIDMRSRRPDDPNDLYTHRHRRELRGLFVVCSWVGNWDTKDHQSLDTFVESKDSLGYVRHHLLDFGAALGAAAEGVRKAERGYEYTIDGKWIALRFLTLGFIREPWRKIPQGATIPSLGNFESTVYEPQDFRPLQPHPAFREANDADDYWGAKLVASFSDAQIAAAIDAAGYEDPRVKPALLQLLIERRDKVARHYFERVVPLDFFEVRDDRLVFHDLAVDRRLTAARGYEVEVARDRGRNTNQRVRLQGTSMSLGELGPEARRVELEFRAVGLNAEPVRVTLTREEGPWRIESVRHA